MNVGALGRELPCPMGISIRSLTQYHRREEETLGGDNLDEEWRQLAPAWIEEVRQGTNAPRAGLLDQAMIDACGDVRGLTILDSGCGEGRFCRMLLHHGAEHVLGLDRCEQMIHAAGELATGRDAYRVADVQDLGF